MFSYIMVWVFGLVSLAVYGVDTFTAVNLLAFSRWASQIQPSIPFHISRWIFAACIIASFVLLGFRWIHTIRVIRSGSIAESYLDPLAVRVQSMRIGRGQGFKRFLVFAELTKSKKGADYVALFAYFSFEAWMRVLFADGPRQVVNAITLYSVMKLDLIPEGEHAAPEGTSPVVQFFINVKALADHNNLQAVILFGMLFTLVIWVISVLNLAVSVVLYLIFLWHHIPSEDGSLKRYCRRKINRRLERIVLEKTNKALAKNENIVLRERNQTFQSGEELKPIKAAPTLPSVADLEYGVKPAASVSVTSLSRQPTQSSLPSYSSQTGSGVLNQQPTLPRLNPEPPLPENSASDSSGLLSNAAPMGYSPLDSNSQPLPPVPPSSLNSAAFQENRGISGHSRMEGPGYRSPTSGNQGHPPFPQRSFTSPDISTGPNRTFSPVGNTRPYNPAGNFTPEYSSMTPPERTYSPYEKRPGSTRPPPPLHTRNLSQSSHGGYAPFPGSRGGMRAEDVPRAATASPSTMRRPNRPPRQPPPNEYDYDPLSYYSSAR